MAGIGAMMNIGQGALLGSQSALQTVGNNIANVNTDGYSRQAVRFEAYHSLDYNPGQMGQGVNAVEVTRSFNKFVERSFLQKNSEANRWATQYSNMSGIEGVFNESYGYGIGSLVSNFFNGWEKLSQYPDDMSIRQALVSTSQTLTDSMRYASSSLQKAVESAESQVIAQVAQANALMKEIANLNVQINMHYEAGRNNPNSLLDARDALVRELGTLIDVDVIDNGAGDYYVNMKGGHTLVQEGVAFELSYEGPNTFYTKTSGSTFDGEVLFNGSDGYEYHIEVVTSGTVGGGAQFKVSLDGGRTWVTDDDGNVMIFDAEDSTRPIKVKDLEIYFDPGSGNALLEGDRFTIVPKSALYWIEPTIGPMLVTPQQMASGQDNTLRATGGSIAGNLLFMDYQAGVINDQLDEFAKNLIWEVNRLHTQGTGLQHFNSVLGTYQVRDINFGLNELYSGLTYGDRLQAGSFSLALYDSDGNAVMIEPGMKSAIDINFTPNMSLDDLVNAMNAVTVDYYDSAGVLQSGVLLSTLLNIGITDNRLSITSAGDLSFGFGNDTTGLLAALGINTYFTGDSAGNIGLNDNIVQNHNFINAGRIDGGAEQQSGDNAIASAIGGLIDKRITFTDWTGRSTNQTLVEYYATLVSTVGSMTANAEFQANSTATQALQLSDTQDSISGVNLDEEMTSLIRFQSSYKAAAKLITTADEMLQTILGMKN